jgi:hypothetical protein
MTYNAAIPQASDAISQSQPSLLTNFNQLDTLFNIDHIKFDDATVAKRGRHIKITFDAPLGAAPGLASPIASLYTAAVGGITELFFQNDVGAGDIYQMTNLAVTAPGNGGTAAGSLYVMDTPWGIRFYMGETNAFTSTTKTVTFPVALTTAVYYYSAGATNTGGGRTVTAGLQGGNVGLTIGYGTGGTTATWIAIGVL